MQTIKMKKTQTPKRNTNIPPKTHQNTHTQTHRPLPYCSSSYKTYSISRSRSRSQEARHISK